MNNQTKRNKDLEQVLAENLSDCNILGSKVLYFKKIDSTNTYAQQLVKNNIVTDGTLIVAEEQTHGRGQYQRKWHSPLGGVWLSYITYTPYHFSKPGMLSLAVGVACCETLRQYIPDTTIKWPNDLIINDKKIGGILIEADKEYTIIGVGVNTNLAAMDAHLDDINKPPHSQHTNLKDIATSTYINLGKDIDNISFITEFSRCLDKYYTELQNNSYETIIEAYNSYCSSLNRDVVVYKHNKKGYIGVTQKIDNNGFLVIKTINDDMITIISDEIFYL